MNKEWKESERIMKEMSELEKYYNKFNEDKRLTRRHGQVEFITSMKYIHKYLEDMKGSGKKDIKILDIGAGTGRYSVALAEEGYDVTAVELVRYNLGILKSKGSSVKAMQGNAMHLSKIADQSFDLTLLFGPMYHLCSLEDKIQAMREAKRVTKPGGIVMVAYCMNEYGVITYGFKENHVKECLKDGRLTEDFSCVALEGDLYDYVRLEEIEKINELAGMKRIQILSADGPADYLRQVLNAMDEDTFALFIRYHLSTCERPELLGAAAHTLDILTF